MSYFRKRYHPPGTSPGTLVRHEQARRTPLRILLTDFTGSELSEKRLDSPAECRDYLSRDTVTWVHVQGDAEPDLLHQLGQVFNLHNLALEDVINTGQRPKVDDFGEQLFVVLSRPVMESDGSGFATRQLSLFLGRNFVLSFHAGDSDPFDAVRGQLRERSERIRTRGADFLFYTLIDFTIDEAFPILEQLGEAVEQLEDDILESPSNDSVRRIYDLKRGLTILRRALWPQREVMHRLARDGCSLFSAEDRIYYSDCYDHTIQIVDLLETYRDMVTGLLDVYLSSISYRLNETMRVLTVIATIFIPLTFISGVYGMNFSNPGSPWAMPELRWYFGYPLVLLLMAGVAVGMLSFFRRRGWL